MPGIIGAAIILAILFPRFMAYLPALCGFGGLLLLGVRGARLPRAGLITVAVVAVLCPLSALWALDPAYSLEEAGKISAILLGGLMLWAALSRVDRAAILRFWWLLPAITLAALTLHTSEYFTGYAVFRFLRDIPADAYVYSHELNRSSVILCVLAPLLAALCYAGLRQTVTRLRAGLAAAFFALCFVPLLLVTESQSAHICFAAGFLTLLLWPVGRRVYWIGMAVISCAVIFTSPFVIPKIFDALAKPEATISTEYGWKERANVMPRLEVWDYISRYALQKPLTGYGVEATRRVPAFDTAEIYQPGKTNLHPHNNILQIWIEFGVIGAVIFTALIGLFFRSVYTLPEPAQRRIALASFMGLGAVSAVGYGMWQSWWVGLVMFAAGVCLMVVRAYSSGSGSLTAD